MTSPRLLTAAACVLGLGGAVLVVPALADDVTLGSGAPEQITGLAFDDAAEEVLVTDAAGTITAWGITGADSRPVTFTGDVESVQGLSMLDGMVYIGDIGDEAEEREFVTVFRINPEEGSTNYRAWDFSYSGGARDAKAMAVSGKGRVYIVTGGDDPGIYRAGLELSRTEVNKLVRSADAPAGVTDAVFLDDGSTLMLRTATGVELVDAYTWEVQAATTYVGAPVGESITTFGADRMLVGGSASLRDEPLPDGLTTATPVPSLEPPTQTPSPSATQPPTPEPTAVTPAPEDQTPAVSRRGTILALVAAGVVAVLAGVGVFVARD